MEDHFAVIGALAVGDTITVINGIPYRQSHHRWWTSCTRYYYGSDRHHTMKWLEQVLTEPIPPGYRIPIIRGLRNFSYTYRDDHLIYQRIITLLTNILDRYPVDRNDIIRLLDFPDVHHQAIASDYDLVTTILKYGLPYLPVILPW